MKINSKRELQNIAINHSADIDCKSFLKLTENVKKNHILFSQLMQHYQQVIL